MRCLPNVCSRPRHFKFRLKGDEEFIHVVFVKIIYNDNKVILYVAVRSTHCHVDRWLPIISLDAIWQVSCLGWIDTYLSSPNLVAYSNGRIFIAHAFSQNFASIDTNLKTIPVETLHSMSTVGKYHAAVRRAYHVVTAALVLNAKAVLQVTAKAVSDSVGPHGFVPTLLVSGAHPRLGFRTDPPSPSLFDGFRAFKASIQVFRSDKSLESFPIANLFTSD